jgi:hypothetical protein
MFTQLEKHNKQRIAAVQRSKSQKQLTRVPSRMSNLHAIDRLAKPLPRKQV